MLVLKKASIKLTERSLRIWVVTLANIAGKSICSVPCSSLLIVQRQGGGRLGLAEDGDTEGKEESESDELLMSNTVQAI